MSFLTTTLIIIVSVFVTAFVIYLIRKQRVYSWGWCYDSYQLHGKTFIITGSNSGLGFQTAKALAKRGATVIMACRSTERAEVAIARIRKETEEGELIPLELDLACFDSIRRFCDVIKEKYSRFCCLIKNAGVSLKTPTLTKEDIEIHTGVNHCGHFLLTNLLLEAIKTNKAKVVIVSSQLHEHGKIDFDSFGKIEDGKKINYYNNSKLMNFYTAKELYRRGIDVNVLCPGLCATNLFRDYDPKFYHFILFSPVILFNLRSSQQGAQNIIYCATNNVNSNEINPNTSYMVMNLKQRKSKIHLKDDISERLWAESEELCRLN